MLDPEKNSLVCMFLCNISPRRNSTQSVRMIFITKYIIYKIKNKEISLVKIKSCFGRYVFK